MFQRFLSLPMLGVVMLSLTGLIAILVVDPVRGGEGSKGLYFPWVLAIVVYFVLRIWRNWRQGKALRNEWIGLVVVSHVIGLLWIVWGPLTYPTTIYAVEVLEIEFWVMLVVFATCGASACMLLVCREWMVGDSIPAKVACYAGVGVSCAAIFLLTHAIFILAQTMREVYRALGADLPGSTNAMMTNSGYAYGIPIVAILVGAATCFLAQRRKWKARVFDTLIALFGLANIGSVIAFTIVFLPTFPACGDLWDNWARDRPGYSRMQIAALLGREASVARILARAPWISPQALGDALISTVMGNQEFMARQMLDRGADVNVRANDGGTALHVAVRLGRTDFVKLLLTAGADVNVTGVDGTPLDATRVLKADAIVELLLQHGAIPATGEMKRQSEAWRKQQFDARARAGNSCTDTVGRRG